MFFYSTLNSSNYGLSIYEFSINIYNEWYNLTILFLSKLKNNFEYDRVKIRENTNEVIIYRLKKQYDKFVHYKLIFLLYFYFYFLSFTWNMSSWSIFTIFSKESLSLIINRWDHFARVLFDILISSPVTWSYTQLKVYWVMNIIKGVKIQIAIPKLSSTQQHRCVVRQESILKFWKYYYYLIKSITNILNMKDNYLIININSFYTNLISV